MTSLQYSEIDPLRMYFGDPYPLTDKIIIYEPSIGDIIDYGERKFFEMLNNFITNTTAYRLPLWHMGVDWNKISDFDLFTVLVKQLNVEQTRIMFGDVDFSTFDMYNKQILNEDKDNQDKKIDVVHTFYSKEQDIEIDEAVYKQLALYCRTMFNIFPKVEKAKGKATKRAIIEEDEMNLAAKKDEPWSSTLLPLISSCLNHPGFKYKKSELREVGIVEFMDSVQRLQVYESTTALLKGMYSGMIDVKSIDKEEFNFMRDLSKKTN